MTNFRFKKQDGTFIYFKHIDAGFIENEGLSIGMDAIIFDNKEFPDLIVDNKDCIENRQKRYEALREALLKKHNIDLEKCQRLQSMWAFFEDWHCMDYEKNNENHNET